MNRVMVFTVRSIVAKKSSLRASIGEVLRHYAGLAEIEESGCHRVKQEKDGGVQ
jgi:hypothetical protein